MLQAAEFADQLHAFGQTTDREFVTLARQVGELQSQNGELSAQAIELLQLLERNSDANGFADTFDIGKRAIELVHSSVGVAFTLNLQFESLGLLIHKCRDIGASLEGNRMIFRCLAVGFSIEAATCPPEHQTVFKTVADNFTKIDRDIQKTIATNFQELERILAEAESSHGRSRQVPSEQVDTAQTEKHLEGIRANIFELETHLNESSEICRSIKRHSEELEASLLPILMSLQYQDIVRQKLEHVSSGLEAIRDLALAQRKQGIGEILAAAKLQSLQLERAKTEIRNSGDAVISGISSSIHSSTEVAQRLSALNDALSLRFGNGGVAYAFGQAIQELIHLVAATREKLSKIAQLGDKAEKTINTFAHDISHQQQDIRIIALNAQIAAARLEEGGALERLAKETSCIADANERTTTELRKALQAALANLEETRDATTEQIENLTCEMDVLEARSRQVDQNLGQTISKATAKAQSMLQRSRETEQASRQALSQINFPAQIELEFPKVEAALDAVLGFGKQALGKRSLKQADLKAIEDQQTLYTMQGEREVHAAVCSQLSKSGDLELF